MRLIFSTALLLLTGCTSQAELREPGYTDIEVKALLLDLSDDHPVARAEQRAEGSELDKVVNGKPVQPGQYPYQVSLGMMWRPDPFQAHFCGGTLIGERHVLTAAHCVEKMKSAFIVVTAGTHLLDRSSKRVEVSRIAIHPRFDRSTFEADVAVLELKSDVAMGTSVRDRLVLKEVELIPGEHLTVLGWGATQENGSKSRIMLSAEVPSVANTTCNKPRAHNGKVLPDQICAGTAEPGKPDSCQADSGGALVRRTATNDVQVGIVSWGSGCARAEQYGVYTSISAHLPWIQACLKNQPSATECLYKD